MASKWKSRKCLNSPVMLENTQSSEQISSTRLRLGTSIDITINIIKPSLVFPTRISNLKVTVWAGAMQPSVDITINNNNFIRRLTV